MGRRITYRNYTADFETTVYDRQTETKVWAAAFIPLDLKTHPDNVTVFNCLDNFMNELFELPGNKKLYFHNLRFDGSFIIPWVFEHGFKMWTWGHDDKQIIPDRPVSEMPGKTFTCLIDDMGQWYSITLHYRHRFITFVDSLKLLPFTVEAIGKAFDTEYRKLSIEYEGERDDDYVMTEEEREYLKNDVLVMHEALNKLFDMSGEERMTIASLALSEYKKVTFHDDDEFKKVFPDLTKVDCPVEGFDNADHYIRQSYHGGWCYLNPKYTNTPDKHVIVKNGCTADVNSLYPSMLHSDSGNVYPYGKPIWFKDEIPQAVLKQSEEGRVYYFVRVRTRFYLKKNHLPTIQIKNDPKYPAREWLTTSDVNGLNVYKDFDGNIKKATVEMVLTQTDYKLLQDHYNLQDFEILDGCVFRAASGMFDTYINKWSKIKQESKGAMRSYSKLMLNSLYGKFASSTNSSYKIPYISEEGILKAKLVIDNSKDAGHIATASACTSYARNFTIRHAQANYNHFVYADTDSIHANCNRRYLKDIKEHPTAFNCWKIENEWDKAVFVRAKTYIEHTIKEDGKDVEPYYLIKCAGMGKNAKRVVNEWLQDGTISIEDFTTGLVVPHNLKARQIIGGTILVDDEYRIR